DKDIPRFILCALFGLAINQIFFFEGLNLTTAVNSSIIMTINPLLVLVFSRVIIGDRITWMKTFGIICGASGAVFLILNKGSISFASGTFVGNTFTFINATSFALYLVLVKPLMMKYSPLTVMKWIFAFGFIIVFPLCIGKVIRTDYASIPVSAWFSLSYIVIAATILGYLLYNYSLRFLSPASTSSYIYLQPLLASLTSFFLGRETITWLDAGCALLIFTGVFLVSYRSSRRKVFS
ncbi:MAG: EamA family transporter, partial [Bacteroidetes bacterium]|nr:EamA family transporter [Bacteroidota bacterium]